MKKWHSRLFWLYMLLIPGFAVAGTPSFQGYNVDVDPGIQVIDNADGSALVIGTFDLYNNQAPNTILDASDFTVKVDGNPTQATIVPPPPPFKMADIVFCMDVSGSMGGEINAIKANAQAFVNKLSSQNFHVQLGLITFGQRPAPYLRKRYNGQFYPSEQDFINEFSSLQARGGHEEWFDCLVLASQYPYRAGAERTVILITDENGDSKNYNINSALPVVIANATKVYGVSYTRLGNVVKAVNQTNGALYNATDPFDKILDKIADNIIYTYGVSLLTYVGPGDHHLHVAPKTNDPGGEDKEPFKIGANPVIKLTQTAQDLINVGVSPGPVTLTIEAEVIDPDGSIQTVNMIWEHLVPTGTRMKRATTSAIAAGTNAMNSIGANIYSGTQTLTLAEKECFAFMVQAIDNEGRNTTVPANLGSSLGGQWLICADGAPVIGTITPDTYDYQLPVTVSAEVTDDKDIPAVTLRYRELGEAIWVDTPMSDGGANVFTATISDLFTNFKGLELEVVAQDTSNHVTTVAHTLTVNNVPVTIVDVTRHTDTLDTGPFSVHAVVAGLDLASGGQVNLIYSGGSLPMTASVTAASMPNTNSNIYVEKIPAVNPGDNVCYHVEATNPTASASSPETCFEVLQPAAPLTVTPSSAIMAMGDSAIEFIAGGGYGTYGWSTMNGALSTTLGDTTRYTPVLAGLDKINVADIKGFAATAIIEVLPALSIDPAIDGKRFSPSANVQLTATGAEPPYQWQVDGAAAFAPTGTDNETVDITLGVEPATITATVTDAKGRVHKVSFTNNGVLTLDPASSEIGVAVNSETPFMVTGGDGSYTWTIIGGDVDNPNAANVNYKAPGLPGIYYVTVSDGNGDSATVKVKVGEPFRVTPQIARILRGDTASFQVVSGTPPYLWFTDFGQLSATEGEQITFTPESSLGLYTIMGVDGAGALVQRTVQMIEGMVVTPASASTPINGTVSLEVTGGNGNYTWSANVGSVSPNTGGTITYTCPGEVGAAEVTVRDTAGNEAKATIECNSIDGLLTITPAIAAVEINGTVVLEVTGGNPPYTSWTATIGSVSPNAGSSTTYTAPGGVGTATVTVMDSAGNDKTATIKVTKGMVVTPVSTSIPVNSTVSLEVTGGNGDYTWNATIGSVSPNAGNPTTYTCPGEVGAAEVTVGDTAGSSAVAKIECSSVKVSPKITPAIAAVEINGTVVLEVTGGNPPYTSWNATLGDVSPNEGAKVTYTAPGDPGSVDTVTVMDSNGTIASTKVNVESNGLPLAVTPAVASVEINGTVSLTVIGGNGAPYTWSTSAGSVDIIEGKQTKLTVPGDVGSVTVTVQDNSGNVANATIEVVLVVVEPVITPAQMQLGVNETVDLTVAGGKGPYTWTATVGTVSSAGSYTAPASPGEAIVTVKDTGTALTATAKIVVGICDLAVTPSITAVDINQTRDFTVTCGDGNYTWKAERGTLSSTKGATVTYTAPELAGEVDNVTISDDSGNSVNAEVRVLIGEPLMTPAKVHLTAGAVQNFTVQNLVGSEAKWSASGGNITPAGVYTAPASQGSYTITAIDYTSGGQATATVIVGAKGPTLTPSEATVSVGNSISFTASQGEEPYIWRVLGEGSLDSNTGNTVRFTAESTAGEVGLVVSDNQGRTSEAKIAVHGKCQVTPESVMVTSQGTQKFELSGCPVDHWTATQGNIDANGFYTAPAGLGTYTITAHSTATDQASTTVTVANVPVITPAKAWLDRGGNVTLNVVGGVPPYSWVTTAGSVPSSGNSVKYAAPSVSQEVTVTVTDNQGESSEAVVYVDQPLMASPEEIYIEREQTTTIQVTGGVPTFNWKATMGHITINTEIGENAYTAPNVMGEYTITITDRKEGNITTVPVHVTSALKVTPNTRYMNTNETETFRVLGGVPPYAAIVTGEGDDGDIDPTSQDGIFKFTSSDVADNDVIIEFSDNIGQTVQVHAYVELAFSASPKELYVDKGGEVKFKAEGGTGSYTVEFQCGFVEINPNSGMGTYTAPNRYGECSLIVRDSSGQESHITAFIERSIPTISPAIATMAPGETRTFMVNRGAPPYEWAFAGGVVKAMDSSNSVVQITAPQTGASYQLTVEDNAGNVAAATINVEQPLLISPTSYSVYKGESVAVRFYQLGGVGACDWQLADLQEVTRGDDFIVVRPRTDVELGHQYTVACRDQNGDVAQSSIVVGTLPCDLNGNVSIDEQEVAICMDKFFNGESLNGVTINNAQLYVNIENFIAQ